MQAQVVGDTRSENRSRSLPGLELVCGTIDSHVHCCPHINTRTVTVFEAVRAAAAAGMRGIGLMDVFANTSGLAALAMEELQHLGVDVFGGVILEPYVGGLSPRTVRTALSMGYGNGGARFVSLPCHHTAFVATSEGRSPTYVEDCLAILPHRPLPDAIAEIIDLTIEAGAVFNTGHLDSDEHVKVVEVARSMGASKILVPASFLTPDAALEVTKLGATLEFSFFVLSHATAVPQTMIDREHHQFPLADLSQIINIVHAVGTENVILSSDSGALVLPPPVEAFREMLVIFKSRGFSDADIRSMTTTNTAGLFGISLDTNNAA